MAVNLRKKYNGKEEVSHKNRPYRYQLDFYNNGKRIRETIKDVEFLPTDTKEQRKQKKTIINKIKADLEIELANQSNGLVSRQLKKACFIKFFESLTKKKSTSTKGTWETTLKHIEGFQGKKLKFEDVTERWIEKFSNYLLKEVTQNSAITCNEYTEEFKLIQDAYEKLIEHFNQNELKSLVSNSTKDEPNESSSSEIIIIESKYAKALDDDSSDLVYNSNVSILITLFALCSAYPVYDIFKEIFK